MHTIGNHGGGGGGGRPGGGGGGLEITGEAKGFFTIPVMKA